MADAYKFTQMMRENLTNTFKYFGESEHGATIIACSIAVFKGIFRPLFTMMDKKSDPETKKYAAARELLTEVAAFPLYAFTPLIAGKLVDKFAPEGMEVFAKKRMKTNSKFLAICASTLIIPAVCNVIQPPIMGAFKRYQDKKKAKMGLDTTPTINIQTQAVINKPTTTSNSLIKPLYVQNSGMRVGN